MSQKIAYKASKSVVLRSLLNIVFAVSLTMNVFTFFNSQEITSLVIVATTVVITIVCSWSLSKVYTSPKDRGSQ